MGAIPVQEDPISCGQRSPGTTAAERTHPRAHAMRREKPAHRSWKGDATHCNQRKPAHSDEDPTQPKTHL